jgi:hypothetical protein
VEHKTKFKPHAWELDYVYSRLQAFQ